MKSAKYVYVLWFLCIIIFFIFIGVFSCTKIDENSKTIVSSSSKSSMAADNNSNPSLIFFDYKKIKTDITTSIGVKIKNCNIFLDYFGNLCFFGEIQNISSSMKTNIVLTIDFFDKKGNVLHADEFYVDANYLRPKSKVPFVYIFEDSNKYIEIDTVKIGVNYDDYYELLKSNLVVNIENFSYENDILEIKGKIVNIGENKAININLLSTFYDMRNRVVSIKKCFLSKDELLPKEEENFNLDVLFSKYTEDFTHYDLEVFFEDSVEMP